VVSFFFSSFLFIYSFACDLAIYVQCTAYSIRGGRVKIVEVLYRYHILDKKW